MLSVPFKNAAFKDFVSKISYPLCFIAIAIPIAKNVLLPLTIMAA